jgi:glycosyltransferase involved in cell wall biosynthesis
MAAGSPRSDRGVRPMTTATSGSQSPTRLLLDVGVASGKDGARGIGRYVRGLIAAMETWPAERRERIWAIGVSGDSLARFGPRGIASPWLGLRPLDTGWLLGEASLRRGVGKSMADILHATDPHRPWRSRKVRQIVTAYDLIPLHDAALFATWRPHHRWVYGRYLRQLREADRIVAISKATAADLGESLGIGLERIRLVYPVVAAPARIERKPRGEPTFLVVGAPDPQKQPEVAIAALARFREAHGPATLRFVGPASSARVKELMARAVRLGLDGYVHFDGWLPQEQLDAAFAEATALLFTSRIEGFGLPAVEAALRGLPVVAVSTPASRETVAGTAILTGPDPEEIAAAMAVVGEPDPTAVAELAERFSAASVGEALWSAYVDLLEP